MRLMQRVNSFPPAVAALLLILAGCGAAPADGREPDPDKAMNRITQLLAGGQPVFGMFSGDHTAEQGVLMGRNAELDFVFFSLESGPFDIPAVHAYLEGLRFAAYELGEEPHPLILRVPPIEDEQATQERVQEALAAGISGIVFPHVANARQAETSVAMLGEALWPRNPEGELVDLLIVEDQEGVENVREIVGTAGVSVVFAGPGDLRRAYDGDPAAVEAAIQTVLSACNELDVPCGITAGVEDIAERLEQGFRVFIVSDPEAVAAGRAAAGRS